MEYHEALRVAQMSHWGCSKANQVIYRAFRGGYEVVAQSYAFGNDIEQDVVAVVEDYGIRLVEGKYRLFEYKHMLNGSDCVEVIDAYQLARHLKLRGFRLVCTYDYSYIKSWVVMDGPKTVGFLGYGVGE